ncbi:hypothetical protein RND71_001514 [Anisodus tanguticus]|uniref:Uncharacterized protein n=1 Tax=Anisodus tanguticus TaxID=243964 RepID=A0AAE1T2K9_9SOLA|nr:hypothetical protein RND71_001514 [Anisodus tanguticus]
MKKNVSPKRVEVAPPRHKQLLSDYSFEKHLDGGEQTKKEKQNHKGNFKKMESDTEKKREEGAQQNPTRHRNKTMGLGATKQCNSGLTKSMPLPLMKMNVATKRVEVAPPNHHNDSFLIVPHRNKATAEDQCKKQQKKIKDMKFESSKRNFEERLA